MEDLDKTNPGAAYWDEKSVREPVKEVLDIPKKYKGKVDRELSARRGDGRRRITRDRLKEKLKAKQKQLEEPIIPPVLSEEASLLEAGTQKKKPEKKKKKAKDGEDSPESGQTSPFENTSNVPESIKAYEMANINAVPEDNSKNGEDMTEAKEHVQKTENEDDIVPVEGKHGELPELKAITQFNETKVIKRACAADMSKLIALLRMKLKKGGCHAMLARNNNTCVGYVENAKTKITQRKSLKHNLNYI